MKRDVLAIAAMLYLSGCANAAASRPPLSLAASPPTNGVDDSVVCRGLATRFIGLPAMSDERSPAAPPMAGRWWVRSCSATRAGEELHVRLDGPGWYWVNQRDSGLAVRQQVPFRLKLELDGKLDGSATDGVFSLWFAPTRAPRIALQAPDELDVRSENAWGWLLTHVPLSSAGSKAAERFTSVMTGTLQQELGGGATVTYDLLSGQADATLGRLEPGQVPEHPFKDAPPWLVNEPLLLEPSATQVVGPIEPGSRQLDVAIERGPGVEYRAICAQQMPASYAAISGARLADVPSRAWVESGSVTGLGPHATSLVVDDCSYYLVLNTAGASSTLAALRLRG